MCRWRLGCGVLAALVPLTAWAAATASLSSVFLVHPWDNVVVLLLSAAGGLSNALRKVAANDFDRKATRFAADFMGCIVTGIFTFLWVRDWALKPSEVAAAVLLMSFGGAVVLEQMLLRVSGAISTVLPRHKL